MVQARNERSFFYPAYPPAVKQGVGRPADFFGHRP